MVIVMWPLSGAEKLTLPTLMVCPAKSVVVFSA
jgi:hypothetical protein